MNSPIGLKRNPKRKRLVDFPILPTVVDHHPWGTDITHHVAAVHNLHLLLYGDIADHAPGNVEVGRVQICFNQAAVPDHHGSLDLDPSLHGTLNNQGLAPRDFALDGDAFTDDGL